MDENCIFCQIISGQIPSTKIYEDDKVLAFLDIAPVNDGHTLVVPKKHYVNLEEVPEADLCEIIKVVKKIGKAFKQGLGVLGYNINENNDPIAGQIIPHLHFHIIPRIENDGLQLWPQRKYPNGTMQEVADQIKKAL
ncbi:MAG: HIT family protein [Candidatus Buchananbacteria bacterium]